MNRPKLLDLFAGAGGAARGYQMAGFHVTGIDINKQPRYAGDEFVQADALKYVAEHGWKFDAIHGSPPCQFGTELRHLHQHIEYENFIPETRRLLQQTGKPYVIENVSGARSHLISPIMLCGSTFGLGTNNAELRRHRYFEVYPFFFLTPPCRHFADNVIGIYGGHGRNRRVITVVGHTGGSSTRDARNGFDLHERNEAMGIDWMTQAELSQAIPPAFTRYIGEQLMAMLQPEAA